MDDRIRNSLPDLPVGTVTFLFTDIEGSTELLKQLGDEYADLLEDQRKIVRACLEKWHGQEVDTQGDSFFISFPRATQAISAAVDIQKEIQNQEWPEGVDVRLRMGLHTGEPLTWAEGYVGIDVHRAARIAAVGHGGQVLLSQTTTPLVDENLPDGVSFLDLGRHRLKDLRSPERIGQLVIEGLPTEFPALKSLEKLPDESPIQLTISQPPPFLEEGAEAPPRPTFVAREAELAWLNERLDLALDGEGQIAFVTGGPGRGKSALLAEFMRRSMAKSSDLLAVRGECSAHTGAGDPYQPFRGALGMLLGDLEGAWASGMLTQETAQRLWEAMPRAAQLLLEMSPDLLGVFVSGRTLQARLKGALEGGWSLLEQLGKQVDAESPAPGELAQRNLFEQFEGLLIELSTTHPIILVLDDLQWADSGSINLLFHLMRRLKGRRWMIVGAYRPEEVTIGRGEEPHPLEKLLGEAKRLHGGITLDLGEEAKEKGRAFIDAFIDSEPNKLRKAFREALAAHTGGHPLFTVELLRAMQERGDLIRDEDGRWIEGESLNWDALPARVEGVIEERIGRLEQELREALTIASVEGETFTAQVVAQVQEVGERKLLKRLSGELEKRDRLVRARTESKVGTSFLSLFQFNHVLFQRFLYQNLGYGERRILHREIAGVLEKLYGEETDRIAVQLAFHYANAQCTDKAIHYLQLAGDQARLAYADKEAIDFYLRALDLLKERGDHAGAARTLMKLGLTYHTAFDFKQSRQAYEQGFILWQRAGELETFTPLTPAPHALRLNWPQIITLDPNRSYDSFSNCVITNLFSGLVILGIEKEIMPDVAHSWDVSKGGRKYLFHLRDDVRWTDTTPVTAGDFEYAWKRALDPSTESQSARMLFDIRGALAFHRGEISDPDSVGVHALDDVTLSVELEGPTGYFLYLMANPIALPIPRHVVVAHPNDWTNVEKIVTNGPFRLGSTPGGESMIMVKNKDYHGRFSGNLESVELYFQQDPSDWVNKLEMYNKDLLDIFEILAAMPHVFEIVRTLHAGDYVPQPVSGLYYLSFNLFIEPFNDIRVRQAFVLAVDREALSSIVLKGLVPPAMGGLVPPNLPGHTPGIGLAYDPDGARNLLAEAGYPDGRGFPRIHLLAPDIADVVIDFLQSQWRDNLGIEIEWERTGWHEFIDRNLSEEVSEICWGGWSADYPDPDNFLRVALDISRNNLQNEGFHKLVEKARRITDQKERMDLYKQADKILIEEALVMPLHYGGSGPFFKPWVSKCPAPIDFIYHWKDVILDPH